MTVESNCRQSGYDCGGDGYEMVMMAIMMVIMMVDGGYDGVVMVMRWL